MNTELIDEAYNALEMADAELALELADKLLAAKHIRGFEIAGRALQMLRRFPEAITLLTEATGKAPDASPLWELLGNVYSDNEDFSEALMAYKKALSCPTADLDSLNFNIALCLYRSGQFEEAMEYSKKMESTPLRLKGLAIQVAIYNATQSFDDAIMLANSITSEILAQEELEDDNMSTLAGCYAEMGRAHWDARGDRQSAWEYAWKALEWERAEAGALKLVRELYGRRSPNSLWLRVTVDGTWHFSLETDKAPPAFVTVYDVVAESPDDAMLYAKNLEPPEIRDSMKLREVKNRGPVPTYLQGVYWRSVYNFAT